MDTDIAARKTAIRRELLAARWAMTATERDQAHHGIGRHLRSMVANMVAGLVAKQRPATIAAYVPVGTEPLASEPSAAELADGGVSNPDRPILPELLRAAESMTGPTEPRILLPIWRADDDLDWARYTGPDGVAASPRGLWEPTGPVLGVDAIGDADLVLVPALAVDRHGHRLGRGAGCYDRALPRTKATTVALVYDHELIDEVPHAPHDVSVSVVITPSGPHRMQ